jgi:hypothetical protein
MQETNSLRDGGADREQWSRTHLRAPDWSIDRASGRVWDAVSDVPDIRDQIYNPAPLPLRPFELSQKKEWWSFGRVRDQGRYPSCVGHALAAVVDHLRAQSLERSPRRGERTIRGEDKQTLEKPWVSWRMLYQMARYHDEWPGEGYNGSSIRGGLKGFFYNGVCAIDDEPDFSKVSVLQPRPDGWSWSMNKELLDQARTIQLGAYYRILPRLPDMQSALAQTGVVIASAYTHEGWREPTPTAEIVFNANKPRTQRASTGMHAFAIVGYDERGFWIQNSWGPGWGQQGLAIWHYDDWAANVCDAWVLNLAVLPPADGGRRYGILRARGSNIDRNETHFLGKAQLDFTGPSRLDVLGHFVPFCDGRLDSTGPYNVDSLTLEESLELIARRSSEVGERKHGGQKFVPLNIKIVPEDFHYRHVLFYFLGGWPDESKLANELTGLIPTFTRLGIYPFFLGWDTVLFNELELLVRRTIAEVGVRTEARVLGRRAARDRLIEKRIALPGNRLLREIRRGARRLFALDQPDPDCKDMSVIRGEAAYCVSRLFEALDARYRAGAVSYHFAAHGFGAQTVVECLAQQAHMETQHDRQSYPAISTCTLISPIVAMDRILPRDDEYLPPSLLEWMTARNDHPRRRGRSSSLLVERLRLIVLARQALGLDRFSDDYGGAWPELWSRVMARDERTIEQHRTRTKSKRDEVPHLPLLAQARYVRYLSNAGREQDIEISFVRARQDDADSSLHHELGFHPRILDIAVREILGKSGDKSDSDIYFDEGGRAIAIGAKDESGEFVE